MTADVFTKKKRSAVMARIRSAGNRTTEVRFASLLRQERIVGWRRHYPMRGRPDFVFPAQRLAIFVDGCFWHACTRCSDGHLPKGNRSYWVQKIAGNRKRDRRVTRSLRKRGWRVWRLRECSVVSVGLQVRRVLTSLRALQVRA